MTQADDGAAGELVEGRDYYVEDGLWVFTADYLLRRGFCCDGGCRHCPYPSVDRPPLDQSSDS